MEKEIYKYIIYFIDTVAVNYNLKYAHSPNINEPSDMGRINVHKF
jgi:hypothetical protein